MVGPRGSLRNCQFAPSGRARSPRSGGGRSRCGAAGICLRLTSARMLCALIARWLPAAATSSQLVLLGACWARRSTTRRAIRSASASVISTVKFIGQVAGAGRRQTPRTHQTRVPSRGQTQRRPHGRSLRPRGPPRCPSGCAGPRPPSRFCHRLFVSEHPRGQSRMATLPLDPIDQDVGRSLRVVGVGRAVSRRSRRRACRRQGSIPVSAHTRSRSM